MSADRRRRPGQAPKMRRAYPTVVAHRASAQPRTTLTGTTAGVRNPSPPRGSHPGGEATPVTQPAFRTPPCPCNGRFGSKCLTQPSRGVPNRVVLTKAPRVVAPTGAPVLRAMQFGPPWRPDQARAASAAGPCRDLLSDSDGSDRQSTDALPYRETRRSLPPSGWPETQGPLRRKAAAPSSPPRRRGRR